jgi:hypothetical protein
VRVAKEVAKSVYPKAEVGAAVFAPSLAPLVGQSYVDLASILDFIQPMVYHKGGGLACINFELSQLIDEFSKGEDQVSVLNEAYRLLTYIRHDPPESLKAVLEDGLPVGIVEDEVWRARKILGTVKGSIKAKLSPIMFVVGCEGEALNEILRCVLASEPDGIVFFSYYEGLRDLDFLLRI